MIKMNPFIAALQLISILCCFSNSYSNAFSPSPPLRTTANKSPLHESSSGTTATVKASNENDECAFTFGVLADIQYAPIPNGFSFNGTPRYYRHALSTAKHAASHFEDENVSLVVNLGDSIDGKCQEIEKWCKDEIVNNSSPLTRNGADTLTEIEEERDESKSCATIATADTSSLPPNPGHDAIDDVIKALSNYRYGPILHTYGNHELYNLSRKEISTKLAIPFVQEPCGDLVGYYSYSSPKYPKLRFVVLDSYDISIMQRCPDKSTKRQKAQEILAENNPNYPSLENSPEGLNGEEKRFVAFNGAIDEPQKVWLKETLNNAKECGQKVIILSHQPIMPKSSGDVCLIWNYLDILDILRQYKCTVAAAFAGHAHKGGYKRDEESGIHFRVFEAVLESKDPIKTYAFVDFYNDRLVVRGYGDCKSATYLLDHLS